MQIAPKKFQLSASREQWLRPALVTVAFRAIYDFVLFLFCLHWKNMEKTSHVIFAHCNVIAFSSVLLHYKTRFFSIVSPPSHSRSCWVKNVFNKTRFENFMNEKNGKILWSDALEQIAVAFSATLKATTETMELFRWFALHGNLNFVLVWCNTSCTTTVVVMEFLFSIEIRSF